jgi:DNA-binding protein H-NS
MSDSSLDAIDKEILALQEKRKAIYDKDRGTALKTTMEAVKKFTFTAEELGITAPVMEKMVAASKTVKSTSTSKAEPKYQDPVTGKTWAGGKGPQPKFIKAQLDAGKSIDEFLIKK